MRASVAIIIVLAGLVLVSLGLWLVFPSVAQMAIERWLAGQGYHDVSVTLSRPSWSRVDIVEVRFAQALRQERLTVHLRGISIEYGPRSLFSGRLERVTISDGSVVLQKLRLSQAGSDQLEAEVPLESETEPLDLVTVSDLVQGVPVLPLKELTVRRLTMMREGVTGPLRQAAISGTVRQQDEGVFVELLFKGDGVQSYVLRVTDLATGVLSIQLEQESSPRKPFAYWRTEAESAGAQIRLHGQVDLDIQQLAPFLAILFPSSLESSSASGRVQATWSGVAPSETALASVWRSPATNIEGIVQTQMRLRDVRGVGRDFVIAATGKFHGNAEGMRWVIQPGTLLAASVDATRVAGLRPIRQHLSPGAYPLRVESTGELTGDLHWSESPIRFSMTGPLTTSYGDGSSPMRLRATVTQVAGRGSVITVAEGTFRCDGHLPDSLARTLSSAAVTADLTGLLRWDGQVVRGQLNQASYVAAVGVSADKLRTDKVKLTVTEAVPFTIDARAGVWALEASSATIDTPEIHIDDGRLRAEPAILTMQSARGAPALTDAQGTLAIRGVKVVHPRGTVPLSDWRIRFRADRSTANAEIEAKLRSHPIVAAAVVQHEWEFRRGTIHLTASPVTFDRTAFRLQQVMSPWHYPFDVTGGTLSASLDLLWGPDSDQPDHPVRLRSGSGEVSLDRISGQYRDIPITGMSGTLALRTEGGDRFTMVRPAKVTVQSVNPGVEVKNVAMTVDAEWNRTEELPTVEIREFVCEILGGTITSQGTRAQLGRPPHVFTMLVKQVDLQRVLSLEQQQGLEGSGILDGAIPMIVSARGVAVKDGQFSARPPGGVIRYRTSSDTSKAVSRANASMDVVLQALNNFHYNVLQVGAQYAEDGTLNLAARLEGRNPDLKQSPPFHFNLTVQENVPALLKSLRLVQDIEESLQKRFVRP